MKVRQVNERVFNVELNDAELDDIMHEAVYSKISTLDVMKAVFLMTFVQVCGCRYFRRTLRERDKVEKSENETDKNDREYKEG